MKNVEFEHLKKLAANAATIYNFIGYSFSGLDLSDICIEGACLKGAIMHKTCLKGSDLSFVDFTDSVLIGADLSDAVLECTEFGLNPSFTKHKGSIKAIAFTYNG